MVAAVAALAIVVGQGGGASSPPHRDLRRERAAEQREREAELRVRLGEALRHGVDEAASLGGTVEAALMLDRWQTPLVETSEADGEGRFMRMWSMSKVATMIALLRQLGWGEHPGRALSAEVSEALRGAITRSENCRQRRVVLELQRAAGGTAVARAAMAGVFRVSGARARIGSEVEAPESVCLPFLEAQTAIADPLAPALLLGTSTWRVGDAARLMHALSIDAFGRAVSARVLGLMRLPKRVSREVPPSELTAPLDWGAGVVLPGDPAYKAGWGGSLNGNFLAGQIALATLPGLGRVSIAAMFHPDRQPSRDDPGITAAPRAIESIFEAVREASSG